MGNELNDQRLHAFDNLRALMMWLGVVLHVCVNHLTIKTPIPWKDADVSPLADLLFIFIHAFRMPAFFILAGFLAAMMVAKRGVGAMLRNRLRRIALPFAVFWPLLFAGMGVLVLLWSHRMARGTLGIDLALAPKLPGGGGLTTMHMWFIYYLMWFCLAAALVRLLPERLLAGAQAVLQALAARWWCVPLLAIPLALAGSVYEAGVVPANGSFIPNMYEFTHNGLFFLTGWVMFHAREQLLPIYTRQWGLLLGLGLVTFIISIKLFSLYHGGPARLAHAELLNAFFYGMTSLFWSLGLVGMFLRYLPRQNRVLRYLSDSSYWVFMVHMLGTLGFGVLLYSAPIGALGKMGANIALTTLASLASYHLLVRRTWIGRLLNGKQRAPGAAQAAGAVPAAV